MSQSHLTHQILVNGHWLDVGENRVSVEDEKALEEAWESHKQRNAAAVKTNWSTSAAQNVLKGAQWISQGSNCEMLRPDPWGGETEGRVPCGV